MVSHLPRLAVQELLKEYPVGPLLEATPSGPLTGRVLMGAELRDYGDVCGGVLDVLGDTIAAELARGAIVLLGEIHDNPFHHRFRAALLRDLQVVPVTIAHWPASRLGVVFEQFATDQQAAIIAAQTGKPAVDRFLADVSWPTSSWSSYPYEPLFNAVLAARLPIYAGDVPKPLIRAASKQGEAAVPPEERTRLGLDALLEPRLQDAILTELEASHCGMMPKSAFSNMAFAQRLRDATLADVALKAHKEHGSAIVMAGNGHVRSDRGIAAYIRARAPGVKVVTVALVEIEDGQTDPASYIPRDPDGRPAVDYIVFTPKAARPDPCDAFRKTPAKP
jgi:uncharacterized iron-regulated protein